MSRFGRLEAHDDRDAGYSMRSLISATPPTVLPLPTAAYVWLPRTYPLNQGNLPHCVGFASRAALDAGPIVNTGGPPPHQIYFEAQKRDEWPGEAYDGTSARGAMKYLQELGYIQSYAWAWDAATIRLWHLERRRPTLLGVTWYDSFDSLDRHGFATLTERSRPLGGHEVVTVGWDDRRGAVRCLNSWGLGYGERGRFWLAGETLDRLLREGGDCVTPLEVKWPPAPTDTSP